MDKLELRKFTDYIDEQVCCMTLDVYFDFNDMLERYIAEHEQEYKPEYKLISTTCVNSHWIASFLAEEDQEYCECGMCKVNVRRSDG